MNDPIVLLKKDHREVEAMLKTLSTSSPGARRRATVEKVTSSLQLHMQIEESAIYPLVSRLVGKDDAEEAETEHRLARDGLDKLAELTDEPGFGAAVAMLMAGIKHHVKEEEQELFPALKKKLDREQLLAVGDQVAAAKKRPRRSGAGSKSGGRPTRKSTTKAIAGSMARAV